MRKTLFTGTAIAALIAAGAVASAQQSSSPGASGSSTTQASPSTGGSPPSATSAAPASGSMKSESPPGAKSGASERRTGGAQGRADQKQPGHAGDKAAEADHKTEGGKTAQGDHKAAQRDQGRSEKNSDRQNQAQRDGDKPGAAKSGDAAREKTTQSGDRDRARENTGAASTSVTINTEQRTRVKRHIGDLRVGRVDHVDFSISVGTAVPRSVTLHAVPASIVEVVPAWRRYKFIMVGDEIVIVDPNTLRIIAVVEV